MRLLTKRNFVIAFLIILLLWVSAVFYLIFPDAFDTPFDYRRLNIASYSMTREEYITKYDLRYTGYNNNVNILDKNFDYDYQKLGDILKIWSPNEFDIEKWKNSYFHPSKKSSLLRFNYKNGNDLNLANAARKLDIPFILYNVPELEKEIETTFSLSNLVDKIGSMPRIIEKSNSNKFMYYSIKNLFKVYARFPNWKPPQVETPMTFSAFLRNCEQIESSGLNHPIPNRFYYYWIISAYEGFTTPWIKKAFLFLMDFDSFFKIDPSELRGINCRFAMKGIISASHFDSHNNFISMIRGSKRYILIPPSECPNLELYPAGHPSSRHSYLDWSNSTQVLENEKLYNSKAIEVLLTTGEILYIPSFWFHYIISQDTSIQCNSRVENSLKWLDFMKECGVENDKKYFDKFSSPIRKENNFQDTLQDNWMFNN